MDLYLGLARYGTVFPVSAVVGAVVPAAVCRWGLCPCCPGVGRCLSEVYNHHHFYTCNLISGVEAPPFGPRTAAALLIQRCRRLPSLHVPLAAAAGCRLASGTDIYT